MKGQRWASALTGQFLKRSFPPKPFSAFLRCFILLWFPFSEAADVLLCHHLPCLHWNVTSEQEVNSNKPVKAQTCVNRSRTDATEGNVPVLGFFLHGYKFEAVTVTNATPGWTELPLLLGFYSEHSGSGRVMWVWLDVIPEWLEAETRDKNHVSWPSDCRWVRLDACRCFVCLGLLDTRTTRTCSYKLPFSD